MFTTFTTFPKNPTEFFKVTSDYFSAFPKNEADVKEFLTKVKAVFEAEAANNKEMWEILQKSATGDASFNEIAKANKLAQDLLASTRFAFMLAIPGTIFFLPLLVQFAKDNGFDIVPASVAKEFDIK